MSRNTVILATGNPAKIALFSRGLQFRGIDVDARDPGDAEDNVPVGYRSAVIAKASALTNKLGQDAVVVAHDSGYEFECLNWEPGARTKSWLSDNRHRATEILQPRSRVRVVHWIALQDSSGCQVWHETDTRSIVDDLHDLGDSELPLTNIVVGPSGALDRLMDKISNYITERRNSDDAMLSSGGCDAGFKRAVTYPDCG